jgi:hypothetical protein
VSVWCWDPPVSTTNTALCSISKVNRLPYR